MEWKVPSALTQSGAPHYFYTTKWSTAFFPDYKVERHIFSVLQSGVPQFFRITKRKALFALNFVPECRTFYVYGKCIAFRAVIAAFRFVTTKRNAAYFQKSEAGFTIEYRVFKNSQQITG